MERQSLEPEVMHHKEIFFILFQKEKRLLLAGTVFEPARDDSVHC